MSKPPNEYVMIIGLNVTQISPNFLSETNVNSSDIGQSKIHSERSGQVYSRVYRSLPVLSTGENQCETQGTLLSL